MLKYGPGNRTAMDEVLASLHMDVDDPRFAHAVAENIYYRVEMDGPSFRVWRPDEEGSGHRVSIKQKPNRSVFGRCSCPDFRWRTSKRGFPCKHLWIAAGFLGFVTLPEPEPAGAPGPAGDGEHAVADPR